MNTDRFSALFQEIKNFRQSTPKATLLSIGGRGYYENPTSDLLQFFLLPTNAHPLGTLFFEGLLSALGLKSIPKDSLQEVRRESPTFNNNRIDILLKGEGWIMLIENKIRHVQNNPFDDYEALAQRQKMLNDESYYVILSPDGESHREGWAGLSYRNLIDSLQSRLDRCAPDKKTNKWWHFAQDFITHFDQELYTQAMTPKEIEFVEKNLVELDEATRLQKRYRKHLVSHLATVVGKHNNTSEVWAKDSGWGIEVRHPKWTNNDYLVFWHDENAVDHFGLSIYLVAPPESLLAEARNIFEGNYAMNYWTESNGRYQCWRTEASYRGIGDAEPKLLELSKELFKLFSAG